MTTVKLDDTLKHYVEATQEASSRCRYVLFLLLTASILVAMPLWSGSGLSLMKQEIIVMADIVRWWPLTAKERPTNQNETTRFEAASKNAEVRMGSGYQLLISGQMQTNEAAQWRASFKAKQNDMAKFYDEQFGLVRIPFFGVAFGTNDLGMFAGLAFTVLMALLHFSLRREVENLRYTKAAAQRTGQIKLVYELLAMQQVLRLPPSEHQPDHGVWRNAGRAAFLMPLAMMILVATLDVMTMTTGFAISLKGTIIHILFSVGFTVAVGFVTYSCFAEHRAANEIWRAWFTEIAAANTTNVPSAGTSSTVAAGSDTASAGSGGGPK